MENRKLTIILVLATILVAAGVLRLYDLGEESLWLDECFTLSYSSRPINLLVEALKKDVHPIGYYLPQHLLIDYFGTGEITLRILSVFFGILSVFLTYVLARKIFSWKEGLLAAFFMAISYTSILYSQEAKMYSMFAAFFLLSLYSFIRFLERPSYRKVLFFSVSLALLLYTHIIGLIILVVYVVFYLFSYVLAKKKLETTKSFFDKYHFSPGLFLVLLIVFLLYLPWFEILVDYQLSLLYHFLETKLIEKVGLNLLPLVVVILILVTFSYFVFLYLILKNKVNLDKFFEKSKGIFSLFSNDLFLFILTLSFIITDFVVSTYFFSSVSIIRFGFFILPLLYILLSRILLKVKNNNLALFLFMLFLVSASFELYTYYKIDSKEQFREAAQYIQNEASPNEVLFLHRATITKECFDYYYSGQIEEVRLITPRIDDHLLTNKAQGKEYAYLLLSHNKHTKDYFPSRLDSLYKFEDKKEFIGIRIYKYKISE